MTTVITTLLAGDVVFPSSGEDLRGVYRHAWHELAELNLKAPTADLASPYLVASAVSTVSKTTNASSGNFTMTLNFPKYDVEVTTGNIAYNATAATIQTAIDTALSGETLVTTYVAGDVDADVTGNISANAATITANGTTVNGAAMVVTTSNVDMDAYEMEVTENTVGTQSRPAEAVLALYSVVTPASVPTPQGMIPATGDYLLGDNPFSISPGLQDLLVREIEMNEDETIGNFIRDVIGCV